MAERPATVEASDCRECRHAWTYDGDVFGCGLVPGIYLSARYLSDGDFPTVTAAREGRCTFFGRRPWGRLLIRLGLREPKRRLEVRS